MVIHASQPANHGLRPFASFFHALAASPVVSAPMEATVKLILIALFLSLSARAETVNLLAPNPTQATGTVDRNVDGSVNFTAGFFGVAAIYQQIPLQGRSYDLRAKFTRTNGSDGIGVVFPVGNQKIAAVFGGWGGRYDGLNQCDGYDPSDARNPTQRASAVRNGAALQLLIQVRPNRLTITANGKPYIDIDPTAHKLEPVSNITQRFQDGLGFYVVNGSVHVDTWVLETKDAEESY